MSEEIRTKEKLRIPKWAYVIAVLLGPALLFAAIRIVVMALGALFDLLAKFDYWWVVALVLGYLVVGAVLAGLLSTLEHCEHD